MTAPIRFQIRQAETRDAFPLACLHVDAWQAAYRGIVPDSFLNRLTVKGREIHFARVLDLKRDQILLAEAEGRVSGFIVSGPARNEGLDVTAAEVTGFYVAPVFWRQGIGSSLLEKAVDHLAFLGYRELTLWVLEKNWRARRFYEARGFERSSGLKEFDLGIVVRAVRYRREIEGKS